MMATAVTSEAEKIDTDINSKSSNPEGGDVAPQQNPEQKNELKPESHDEEGTANKNIAERNLNSTPLSDISGNVMDSLVMETDGDTSTTSFDETTLESYQKKLQRQSPIKVEKPKIEDKPPVEEALPHDEKMENEVSEKPKSPVVEEVIFDEDKEETDDVKMEESSSPVEPDFLGFETDEEQDKHDNFALEILDKLIADLQLTSPKKTNDDTDPQPNMSPKRRSDDAEPSSSTDYHGSTPPPSKKLKLSTIDDNSPQSSIDYAMEESDSDDVDKKIDEKLQPQEAIEGEEENVEEMKDEYPETPRQSDKVSSSTLSTSTTSTPGGGKQRPVTDDIYRKPFNYGWKREFVYRAVPGISKDKGEVYYITPSGKKLRTKNDILANLTPELTIENFTFAKAPIGVGAEHEIIRNAKPISRYVQPEINLGKRIPKPKGPKGASPPPVGWTATKAVKAPTTVTTPRQGTAKKQPPSTSQETPEQKPATSSSAKSAGKNKKKNNPLRPSMNSNLDGMSPSIKSSRMSTRSGSGKTRRGTHNSNQDDRLDVGQRSPSGANFFGDVASGYNILLHTFQYLKVQELLRVSSVCRFWNMAANHRSLWKTVRMKNSQVNDWTGLAAALKRNETKHLDLRKMLISNTKGEEMWKSFAQNIQYVISLENIDLCRCSSKIVEDLFLSNPNLKMLNAVTIRDESFSLENVIKLKDLEELRLRSIEGFNLEGDFTLKGDLSPLSTLTKLKHLSLTSFRSLCSQGVKPLANLTNLESLELGYCNELDISFADEVLPKLHKLERLRLEGGAEEVCTLQIMEAISKLDRLTQLELVNFDIKRGFDEKLIACKNLKRLLIIPTYISQSATTNHIIITAALQMGATLDVLTWAVTMELLRVTALYVDQCESPKKESRIDECIPILKPVPGQDNQEEIKVDAAVQQVEILPLPNVEKILHTHMPVTKLKILKVPYHATWRQTIVIGSGKLSSSSNASASTSSVKSKRDRSASDV